MKPLNWEERIRVADHIGFEAMDRMEKINEKINENLNKLTKYLKLGKVYKSFEEWEYVSKEETDRLNTDDIDANLNPNFNIRTEL